MQQNMKYNTNISVTSSTTSQSLRANKKRKLMILNQLFIYLAGTFD